MTPSPQASSKSKGGKDMSELEEILVDFGEGVAHQYGGDTDKNGIEGVDTTKSKLGAYISKHYIKKEDVLEAVGEDEDVLSIVQHYANNLRAEIKEKLNLGDK